MQSRAQMQAQQMEEGAGNEQAAAALNGGAALIQYGSALRDQGQRFSQKYLSLATTQYYFSVTDASTRKKLMLLLVPFLWRGSWSRHVDATSAAFLPPRDDIHAPDLFLPVVSTLALTATRAASCAIIRSLPSNTSVVPTSLWKCALTWACLACIFVLALRSSGAMSVPLLDAVASAGYSLVYIALATIADLFLPYSLSVLARGYICLVSALFAAKSCARSLREGGVRWNVAIVVSAAAIQGLAVLLLGGVPGIDHPRSETAHSAAVPSSSPAS